MDPEKAVVHRSHRLDLPDARLADAIGLIESGQKSREGAVRRGDMPANPDIPLAQAPRNDGEALAGIGVFDPEQLFRQSFAERLVQPAGVVGRRGP